MILHPQAQHHPEGLSSLSRIPKGKSLVSACAGRWRVRWDEKRAGAETGEESSRTYDGSSGQFSCGEQFERDDEELFDGDG